MEKVLHDILVAEDTFLSRKRLWKESWFVLNKTTTKKKTDSGVTHDATHAFLMFNFCNLLYFKV